jgi:hypothetical protein
LPFPKALIKLTINQAIRNITAWPRNEMNILLQIIIRDSSLSGAEN